MTQYLIILFAINMFLIKNDNNLNIGTSWSYKARYENSETIEQIKVQYLDCSVKNDTTFSTFVLNSYNLISGTWSDPQFSKDAKSSDTSTIVTYKDDYGDLRSLILNYDSPIKLFAKSIDIDTQIVLFNGQTCNRINIKDSYSTSYLSGIGIIGGIYKQYYDMPCGCTTPGCCNFYHKYEYELTDKDEVLFDTTQLTTAISNKYIARVVNSSLGNYYTSSDLLGRSYLKNNATGLIIYEKGKSTYKSHIVGF
jgi:hypothetical protein